MSRNLNNIFIFTGNMAKDIEAKYTNEGLCVTSFVVAENVYVGKGKGDIDKKTGEAKDSIAVFYKCYCYNELAEQIGNSAIEVGRQVTITGKLMPDNYTDKNGNPATWYEIVADRISFTGEKSQGGGAYSDYAASVSSAAPAASAAPAPAAPQSPASDFSSAASDDDYPF